MEEGREGGEKKGRKRKVRIKKEGAGEEGEEERKGIGRRWTK